MILSKSLLIHFNPQKIGLRNIFGFPILQAVSVALSDFYSVIIKTLLFHHGILDFIRSFVWSTVQQQHTLLFGSLLGLKNPGCQVA